MCFSPEVSFASAAVLIPTGMFCLWTAARKAPRLWPLAVVPCVFGVQQACEGLVWLGIHCGNGKLCSAAALVYLFFALAFWPIWFSIAAAVIEPNPTRRRFLTVWAVLSTGWFWFAYLPVLDGTCAPGPHVHHQSIRYDHADAMSGAPIVQWAVRLLYVLTATVPALTTSLWRTLLLPASLGVVSAGAAVLAYEHAFTSVWCLFAAVLSVSLVYTIATAPESTDRQAIGV